MNAIIFGATGMVGIEVLHRCLGLEQIQQVVTIGRHVTGVEHPRLREVEHLNFTDYAALEPVLSQADICFYCLGVYQGKVSTEQFWQITVDYLSALIATLERTRKEITFCLFSAQGADPDEKSRFLFANAKGRAEKRLLKSGIRQCYIFRPGYIDPGRKSARSRIPVWVARPFYKLFPAIGIDAPELAKVMVHVGLNGSDRQVFENRDLRLLAKSIQ